LQVTPGVPFSISLDISAAEQLGTKVAGRVLLTFDPTKLTFGGFTPAADVIVPFPATLGTAGGNQTVSVGVSNALDLGSAGIFQFTATNMLTAGTSTQIQLADFGTVIPTFVTLDPANAPFDPTPQFIGLQVQAVPLPASAALLLTGLGFLGARRAIRRQSTQQLAG
jgi:hypothetical protein